MIQSWMTYFQQGLIPDDSGLITITQCMQVQYHIPMAIDHYDVIQPRSAAHSWHGFWRRDHMAGYRSCYRRIVTGEERTCTLHEKSAPKFVPGIRGIDRSKMPSYLADEPCTGKVEQSNDPTPCIHAI